LSRCARARSSSRAQGAQKIDDKHLNAITRIARELSARHAPTDAPWKDSPFAWLRLRSSKQRGTIAEQIVQAWLSGIGLTVEPAESTDYDRLIEGQRVEIKFSTLWSRGIYVFQQFRKQEYDLVLCLGVSPTAAHGWVLPNSVILAQWGRKDGLALQHKGKAGGDTAWLRVRPGTPHPWLAPLGGTLKEALAVLSRHTGYVPPPPP
jgi:hypothetical protein